jgi:hypothetical protein
MPSGVCDVIGIVEEFMVSLAISRPKVEAFSVLEALIVTEFMVSLAQPGIRWKPSVFGRQ